VSSTHLSLSQKIWRSECTALHILNFGSGWRWMVGFTLWLLYCWRTSLQFWLDKKLGGPHIWSGHCSLGNKMCKIVTDFIFCYIILYDKHTHTHTHTYIYIYIYVKFWDLNPTQLWAFSFYYYNMLMLAILAKTCRWQYDRHLKLLCLDWQIISYFWLLYQVSYPSSKVTH